MKNLFPFLPLPRKIRRRTVLKGLAGGAALILLPNPRIKIAWPATTYWASQAGGGNGLSQGSPFQISGFWPLAVAGDTLNLLDGTYTGANSMIVPGGTLSGTSGAKITIKALNDGGVVIDGQYARNTVYLESNSHFVFQGFDVRHGQAQPGDNCITLWTSANNNILQRIVAYDANPGANNPIVECGNNSGNLFEDIAIFGTGRKCFEPYTCASGATLRRVWAQWSYSDFTPGPKMAFSYSYNSHNMLFENCIGTFALQAGSQTDQQIGVFGSDNHGAAPADYVFNTKVIGSIAYARSADNIDGCSGGLNSSTFDVDAHDWEHSVFYIEPGTHTSIRPLFCDTISGATRTYANVTRCTNISALGASIAGGAGGWTQTGNLDVSTVPSGTNNIWDGSSSNGARVLFRYQDGVLTGTKLWPWPMDARINAALTASGRNPNDFFGTNNKLTDLMSSIFGTIPSLGGRTPATGRSQASVRPAAITRTQSNNRGQAQ